MDQTFSDTTTNVARFWCNSRGRMCGSADGWGNCQITGGCTLPPIVNVGYGYDMENPKPKHKCPHCGIEFVE